MSTCNVDLTKIDDLQSLHNDEIDRILNDHLKNKYNKNVQIEIHDTTNNGTPIFVFTKDKKIISNIGYIDDINKEGKQIIKYVDINNKNTW